MYNLIKFLRMQDLQKQMYPTFLNIYINSYDNVYGKIMQSLPNEIKII